MYFRNHDCPAYARCLDLAAKLNGQFDCRYCRHVRDKVIEPDPVDPVSVLLLLAAVFHPAKWQRYRLDKVSVNQSEYYADYAPVEVDKL